AGAPPAPRANGQPGGARRGNRLDREPGHVGDGHPPRPEHATGGQRVRSHDEPASDHPERQQRQRHRGEPEDGPRTGIRVTCRPCAEREKRRQHGERAADPADERAGAVRHPRGPAANSWASARNASFSVSVPTVTRTPSPPNGRTTTARSRQKAANSAEASPSGNHTKFACDGGTS